MPQPPQHHPTYKGSWLHPVQGSFELGPEEHHSAFFKAHPELLGHELNAAYEDAWTSIRRWVGAQEVWALRYHALEPVASTLRRWAAVTLERHPQERDTPIAAFPGNGEPSLPNITLERIATGQLGLVLEGWRSAASDPSAYVWAPRIMGYVKRFPDSRIRVGSHFRFGYFAEADYCWITVGFFERCGGRLEELQDLLIADQAEFDKVASVSWVPAKAGWSTGIAGGEVPLPPLRSLEEAIGFVQKREGPFLNHTGFLKQTHIRTIVIRPDGTEPLVHFHRPQIETKGRERGGRMSFRILA